MKLASEYLSYLNLKKKVDGLKKQISEIEKVIVEKGFNLNSSEEFDLKKIISLENKYKEGTEICRKLNIPYAEEEIQKVVVDLKSATEYYKHSSNRAKLIALKSKLGQEPDYTLEQLEKWRIECSLLTCPNCHSGLRYVEGELKLESAQVSEDSPNQRKNR